MSSVGIFFLSRISQIFTDLVTCYPCSFVSSVGNVLFSHGFHGFSQIWLHVIRVHLCYQWEMFFSPTDFTDFHRFGYMLSVSICVISGKYFFLPRIFTDLHGFGYMLSVFIRVISGNIFSPTDFTDFHRFGFLVAANALGIGAASFWSVSGKRYSGKPDGFAGTPKDNS